MIDPDTGCFDIVEIPTFDLEEVALGNDEYINKSFSRVIQMFNKIWLCRHPRPRKFMFENGSNFKRYFTPLIEEFDIKPVLTSVKKQKANAMVERVHQLILNMLVTKDIDNKVFIYIGPWGENLASIAWAIRAYYHRTIMATQGQAVFDRYMLFNLA